MKEEGGYLYRGVFISKTQGGFTFYILGEHNPKGGSWVRMYPDTLASMKRGVDNYLAQGATVANRKIQKIAKN